MAPPNDTKHDIDGPVRLAFDGDAVLFDQESEVVFQEEGLDALLAREAALADVPMTPGPFANFLSALGRIQHEVGAGHLVIRTSLVTARNAPAHKRVVNTLRHWGVQLDETFFLGGIEKAGVLEVLHPHIFFDDQDAHPLPAQAKIPSARSPGFNRSRQPQSKARSNSTSLELRQISSGPSSVQTTTRSGHGSALAVASSLARLAGFRAWPGRHSATRRGRLG